MTSYSSLVCLIIIDIILRYSFTNKIHKSTSKSTSSLLQLNPPAIFSPAILGILLS